MAGTRAGDADRLLREHAIHDRDVVRGEIPDGVDVCPDRAEVQANRIEVVEVSDVPLRDQLPHLTDRAGEHESAVYREENALALRKIAVLLGVVCAGRGGLRDEAVLARLD